ncbi:MAG: FAD-binding oxidoreductase [Caldilineaceae bacterium]|nr:FAD-binding oxidoreductase [Caldilineaceae bacterium]
MTPVEQAGTKQPRVVVVGGGIIGAAIAFQCARRGAAVTLLDAGAPGGGASRVSFAWINGHGKNPRHYHDLNRRSLDMWPRFARLLDADAELTWGGEVRWAATEEGGVQLTARARQLQSWGYPIQLLEAGGLTRLEPELTPGPVTAATFTGIEGHVNAPNVVALMSARLIEQGGAIQANTPVTGFTTDGERVIAVETPSGSVACDYAVLATGPDTTAVAGLAGVRVPLYHTFGATVYTEPLPPLFTTAALVHTPRDAEPPLNIRQLADGTVVLHGGTHGELHDRSLGESEAEIDLLLMAARRYLPALDNAPIREVRRGRRPIPQDGLPIIGFSPTRPNVYLAAMHSGVTLAALTGEFAAIELLDGAEIDILAPYRPGRFEEE